MAAAYVANLRVASAAAKGALATAGLPSVEPTPPTSELPAASDDDDWTEFNRHLDADAADGAGAAALEELLGAVAAHARVHAGVQAGPALLLHAHHARLVPLRLLLRRPVLLGRLQMPGGAVALGEE